MKKIVIAAGCFWGVQAYFKRVKGVIATRVGYANGNKKYPKYQELLTGMATHAEACEITYDSKITTLGLLLSHMFRIIDPTSLNKQGNDVGIQYRTGIYYSDEKERAIINSFIQSQQSTYNNNILVEVEPLSGFYSAEDYHQDYLDKNPTGYCHINLDLIKPEEFK